MTYYLVNMKIPALKTCQKFQKQVGRAHIFIKCGNNILVQQQYRHLSPFEKQ